MRRHYLIAVSLGLLVGGCGGREAPTLPNDQSVDGRLSLTPSVHLFAEPVVAQVDVVVDRDRIDPGKVRLDASFPPYERLGETSVERHDIGGHTHLLYSTTLRCLDADCIPRTREGQVTVPQLSTGNPVFTTVFSQGQTRAEKRTYMFKPARILYDDPKSGTRVLRSLPWPPLLSLSRVNWSDPQMTRQGFPFQSTLTPLPTPSYRTSPTLLAFTLLGAAVALLGLPTGFAIRSRRRRPPAEAATEPELSPLERALRLADWARDRPEVERRQALEVLAVELETAGRVERAEAVRELAWSSQAPASNDMERFVDLVREEEDALD